jgi:rhamnulose-1-phosphate aldolase
MSDPALDSINEIPEVRRVASALDSLWLCEASAGNLSLRLEELPEGCRGIPEKGTVTLPVPVPELGGSYLLLTRAGSRMREIAQNPRPHLVLLKVHDDGERAAVLAGSEELTSELPAHLAAQRMLKTTRPELKAVLHAHPPGLIALCHIRQFEQKDFVIGTLFRMLPEAKALLPERFVALPYTRPGSIELARATAEALRTHRLVLWEGHGVTAVGATLSEALDRIEVLEKAAGIYLKVLAVGAEPNV